MNRKKLEELEDGYRKGFTIRQMAKIRRMRKFGPEKADVRGKKHRY